MYIIIAIYNKKHKSLINMPEILLFSENVAMFNTKINMMCLLNCCVTHAHAL